MNDVHEVHTDPHTHETNNNSSMFGIMMLILFAIIIFLFFYIGPFSTRNANPVTPQSQAPQVDVPNQIDVNIKEGGEK